MNKNPLRRVFLCLEQNMSAGTIALTNNSDTVTGTGTAFTTDLKPNDFIVVIVGGVTYTLAVKAIASATSLTLVTVYGGPTTSGNAWTAVPNATLVGITAQVASDVAKAIRGLNLDKANWQQVFSGVGTITVTLPDGSTYSGPAWSSITTSLDTKADKTSLDTKASKGANNDITALSGLTTPLAINQGGLGATTAAGGRLALGLGTAALANIGTGANQIPDMNSFISSNSSGSGYIKLPGGTIIQWGYSPSGKLGSPIDTAFPIPFTSTNYTVTVSSDNAAPGSGIVVNGTTQRLNNSVFRLMNSTGDTGYTLFWQAIGR